MTTKTLLPGKFVWFDLFTNDAKKAQAFYGEVLGWKMQSTAIGNESYELALVGEAMIAGYSDLSGTKSPIRPVRSHWLSYVSVPDVDAAVKVVAAEGGKVIDPPTDIPNIGRMAHIADPQGAELALFTSPDGDNPDIEGGAPPGHFFWNELHVPEPEKALGFYGKVVGFTHEKLPMPGDAYHIISSKEGTARGGVTHHMGGATIAHWLPYVHVTNPDETLDRAKKHGGKVPVGPMDIPGAGRFGVIEDPTGAFLAVMKPNPRQ